MSEDGKRERREPKSNGSTKEIGTIFSETIRKFTVEGKKAALFTHAFPDPDAIGSMMAVAWLLQKEFGLESDLFYDGEISHPQNKAVTNLLDPQLKKVAEEYSKDNYCVRILVDTIPINAGVGNHQVDFNLVIDHHKDLPNGGFAGAVIHVKTGSCCSIIYKIIEQLGASFEDDNDHDSKIVTAILAGIMTDTENMISDDSTEVEFDAFSKLFRLRHSKFFKEIMIFKRPKSWIDAKSAATSSAEFTEEGYAIVGLGMIPGTQRDLIADMADEMIQWASVETAIAFAVVDGIRVEGSVRSLNASITVSDLCKKLGGKHGTGGGKHGKGAYRYTLGGFGLDNEEAEDAEKKLWELVKERETCRIKRLIS